jgi:hypothetical protein
VWQIGFLTLGGYVDRLGDVVDDRWRIRPG